MLFVLPVILFVGLIFLGLWWLFFRETIRQEHMVRDARRREADFEHLLTKAGEPLYCVACQEMFSGPLECDGCPKCHVRALVIPARYSEDPKVMAQAAKHSFRQKETVPTCPPPVSVKENTGEKEILPQGTKK